MNFFKEMAKWVSRFVLLVVSFPVLTSASDAVPVWTHVMVLDEGVEVKWVATDPYFLTMEMSAPTRGYVGIGFSPSGGMAGSDIAIGWVDSRGIPQLLVNLTSDFRIGWKLEIKNRKFVSPYLI